MDLSGKIIATIDRPFSFFENDKVTIKRLHGSYNSLNEALESASITNGADAVIFKENKYFLYSIDSTGNPLTRSSLEQTADYPVSHILTDGNQGENVLAIVTDDNYKLESPQVHGNPYSGNHYAFTNNHRRVSPLLFKSKKDMHAILNDNSTRSNSVEMVVEENVQKKLKSTLDILDLYDGKAADWVRSLRKDDIILVDDDQVLAAFTSVYFSEGKVCFNSLVLSDPFWNFSDVDKASMLYHEFQHSQEKVLWRAYNNVEGLIKSKIYSAEKNDVEDKAYLAQLEFLEYFGVTSSMAYEMVKTELHLK